MQQAEFSHIIIDEAGGFHFSEFGGKGASVCGQIVCKFLPGEWNFKFTAAAFYGLRREKRHDFVSQ